MSKINGYKYNAEITIYPEEFEYFSRPYHLTIDDIRKFPVGIPVRIYILSKRALKIASEINPIGTIIKPSLFFRSGYYIYFTRTIGLRGKWHWMWNEILSDRVDKDIEFDVDIEGEWIPLMNSTVPSTEKDSTVSLDIPEFYQGKHWCQLDKTTRVGWCAPMMLAVNMDLCPSIRM